MNKKIAVVIGVGIALILCTLFNLLTLTTLTLPSLHDYLATSTPTTKPMTTTPAATFAFPPTATRYVIKATSTPEGIYALLRPYPGGYILGSSRYPLIYDSLIPEIAAETARILAIPSPYYWEAHQFPSGTTFDDVLIYYNEMLTGDCESLPDYDRQIGSCNFRLIYNEWFGEGGQIIKYRHKDGRMAAIHFLIVDGMPVDAMFIWGGWELPPELAGELW